MGTPQIHVPAAAAGKKHALELQDQDAVQALLMLSGRTCAMQKKAKKQDQEVVVVMMPSLPEAVASWTCKERVVRIDEAHRAATSTMITRISLQAYSVWFVFVKDGCRVLHAKEGLGTLLVDNTSDEHVLMIGQLYCLLLRQHAGWGFEEEIFK